MSDGAPVAALAGRRPDPEDAGTPRFPLANAGVVRSHIAAALRASGARTLVCSAACGADLLALEAAATLGMRRVVVLPFAPDRFRRTSVVDRPGDWAGAYDEVIADTRSHGDLVILSGAGEGDEAYAAATTAILERAAEIAGSEAAVVAIVVWEGAPRGPDDQTAAFAASARSRGMERVEVGTLGTAGGGG